jgi:hypothetical protein
VKFANLAKGRFAGRQPWRGDQGELGLSLRYQEILEPMELGNELRAALLARLTPHLAEGLRTSLLMSIAFTCGIETCRDL